MSVDIAGVLRWKDKDLSAAFLTEDGQKPNGSLVRAWLKLKLAHGMRVLPVGECDNFDFQTGCKGHPDAPHLELQCVGGGPLKPKGGDFMGTAVIETEDR